MPSHFLLIDTQQARVLGDWTLANYVQIKARLAEAENGLEAVTSWDLSALKDLDTAGALLLVELLGPATPAVLQQQPALSTERRALLERVAESMADSAADQAKPKKSNTATELLARIGAAAERFYLDTVELAGFIGLTLETLARTLLRPQQWRLTSTVAQIEVTGLNAVPIVALLTFMVGAVIAFLGATILSDFGAGLYTVNLVAFSFLREFAVLLTAILIAGRTASSFTAQIGSMKANQEIDAIRALGLNPVELLVLPRVFALLVSLPLLTVIGMISGIVGGAVVCALKLGISPLLFVTIMQQQIGITHFVLGIAKAPIFAFLIAVIACNAGFRVKGSAQSVGEKTTSSVVESIFIVIFVDALAALFYMEMGW